MHWFLRYGLFVIICYVASCTRQETISDNNVLAKVGTRIITVQDFIRRAEYAIRPLYCGQSNYIHKKIILNSLIAEKLFSFEAEKTKIDLLDRDNSCSNFRENIAVRNRFLAGATCYIAYNDK